MHWEAMKDSGKLQLIWQSGLSAWDTYILHSWAIGSTERKETAGGSRAVTSPVETPSHNLTTAWPGSTVTMPVRTTNAEEKLSDRQTR